MQFSIIYPPNFWSKCHILMIFCKKCPGRYLKVMKEWRSLPTLATLSVHRIIFCTVWEALQCFKDSLLEDTLLYWLSRLKMSRIVPIFHDFLGLSRLHFGLSKGPDVTLVSRKCFPSVAIGLVEYYFCK